MRSPSILALLVVLCISTSASAQAPAADDGERQFFGTDLMGTSRNDPHRFGDGTVDLCELGNIQACFSLEFGRCADADPRVAIPACTRQLAGQDNRKNPRNLRFGQAVRYALRAMAYAKQGDVDRELLDYDRAVRANTNVFWIHAKRGDAYFLVGAYEEALESYDAAAALDPGNASVFNNRAIIYAAAPDEELRDATQALADAQRANTLAPGQPAYIDVLAVAYAANGDFDMAAAEEQRAIDLLPPGDQVLMDDYRGRLDLFQSETPFQIAIQPET